MRAISIYTALAAAVSVAGVSGRPSGISATGMSDAQRDCHRNCGNCTRIIHNMEDPCDDPNKWKMNFENCTGCVRTYPELWGYYGPTITDAARKCGLETQLPDLSATSTVSTTAMAPPTTTSLSDARQCYLDCVDVITLSRNKNHCERQKWTKRYRRCKACSNRNKLDSVFWESVKNSASNCTEAQLAPPSTAPTQITVAVVRRDVEPERETFPAVARRQEEEEDDDDAFWADIPDIAEEDVLREEMMVSQKEAKLTEDEEQDEEEAEEDDNPMDPQPGSRRTKCHGDCGTAPGPPVWRKGFD